MSICTNQFIVPYKEANSMKTESSVSLLSCTREVHVHTYNGKKHLVTQQTQSSATRPLLRKKV